MKRAIVGSAMLLAAVMIALLAAEATLRAFHLAPVEGLTTMDARQFESLPGHFAPSQDFVDLRNPALPHAVHVDSLGFRGDEVARSPAPGAARVVVIGDSFVYGDFVGERQTLPAQLRDSLRARCGPVEVVNAGLPGATITEYLEIARRVLPLSPDLLVLAFTENDVEDLRDEPMWDEMARHRATKSSFPLGLVYPVLRHAALWNLALQARGKFQAAHGHVLPAPPATGMHGADADPALRAQYAARLHTMAGEASAARVPLLYLTFPAHFTLYGTWTGEQLDWAEASARSEGLPVVSTMTPLKATGLPATELYLLPHDGHPSATGYAVAAGTLAQAIASAPSMSARCLAP